jgi:hypothetical protein
MPRQRTEVIDGVEYTVTTLPQDERLTPSKTKRRQLFASLSHQEKQAVLAGKKRIAREKRKKKRRKR